MYRFLYFLYNLKFSSRTLDDFHFRLMRRVLQHIAPVYFKLVVRYTRSLRGQKKRRPVIVSLTTFPARFESVWLAVASIFAQSVKPDCILLWLSRREFSPNERFPTQLERLQSRGLQIRWCDDNLMPHKKYFYTMQEYPDAVVITVDDDVYYPPTLLARLLKYHRQYPECILCPRTRTIALDVNYRQKSYTLWRNTTRNTGPMHENVAIGVGGVLYPPGSLHPDVFDITTIVQFALRVDDLWLKVMALRNNTKVVSLGGEFSRNYVPVTRASGPALEAQNRLSGHNDVVFDRLRKHYDLKLDRYLGAGT